MSYYYRPLPRQQASLSPSLQGKVSPGFPKGPPPIPKLSPGPSSYQLHYKLSRAELPRSAEHRKDLGYSPTARYPHPTGYPDRLQNRAEEKRRFDSKLDQLKRRLTHINEMAQRIGTRPEPCFPPARPDPPPHQNQYLLTKQPKAVERLASSSKGKFASSTEDWKRKKEDKDKDKDKKDKDKDKEKKDKKDKKEERRPEEEESKQAEPASFSTFSANFSARLKK
jgi:hypothetical protein